MNQGEIFDRILLLFTVIFYQAACRSEKCICFRTIPFHKWNSESTKVIFWRWKRTELENPLFRNRIILVSYKSMNVKEPRNLQVFSIAFTERMQGARKQIERRMKHGTCNHKKYGKGQRRVSASGKGIYIRRVAWQGMPYDGCMRGSGDSGWSRFCIQVGGERRLSGACPGGILSETYPRDDALLCSRNRYDPGNPDRLGSNLLV